MTPGIAALEALARRARDELALFDYPDRAWVTSVHDGNGDPVHNVLVAGGGQNGLAIAFALRRECIDGVTVLGNAAEPIEHAGDLSRRSPHSIGVMT